MVLVVDGNRLALEKEAKLKQKVKQLEEKEVIVKLAVIVMSDDGAGELYAKLKQEAAKRIGIKFEKKVVKDIESNKLVELIKGYGKDDEVQGIMVQRPGINWGKEHGMDRKEFEIWWEKLVKAIQPKKDVDGLRPDSEFLLAAVKAVKMVLDKNGVNKGKMVIVGSKGLMGRELIKYFSTKGFKVKGIDVEDDLVKETIKADILISATGKRNLVKGKMVKNQAVVIDMGWPKGDVEFNKVKNKAKVITPVPGGMGPLTVVSLLENLVENLYTS